MANTGFTDKIHQVTKLAVVVDALVEQGYSMQDALRGTDVSPQDLHSAKTYICLNQLLACYDNALQLSQDPELPYRIGSSIHLSAYGMYGYAILCSVDFRKTMNFAVKYHSLAMPLCAISFAEEKGQGVWTLEPTRHAKIDQRLCRFIVELQIGIHLSLHRDVMGASFEPSEIALTYGQAKDFRLTSELTGCPLRFEQPANKICFNSKWLDAKPQLGTRTTYAAVEAVCDGLLAELEARTGAAGKVRAILVQDIANRPSFEATAKLLGTTTRTLRRQLEQQGTSFRDLVDELRIQIAMKYLAATSMSNEDIAFALGFSDAANFRHAFRRWTHSTPSAVRRQAFVE